MRVGMPLIAAFIVPPYPFHSWDKPQAVAVTAKGIIEGLPTSAMLPKVRDLAKAEFAPLRLQLIKVAAGIIETASRVRFAFVACYPEVDLLRGVPGALAPRPVSDGPSAPPSVPSSA